jgi:hypothetical protein
MARYLRIVSALCFLFFYFSQPLHGARITSLTLSQKLVFIDKGITDGFDEGVKVCFFIGESMLSCGMVVKATLYQAIIKLPEQIDKLSASHSSNPDEIRVRKIRPGKKPTSEGKTPAAFSEEKNSPATEGAPLPRTALRLFWLPTFSSFTTMSLNQMTYEGATSTPSDSLWSSVSPGTSLVLFALGGEVSLPRIGIALGGTYSKYPTIKSSAIYDNPTNGTLNADSSSGGFEFGVFLDYGYALRPHLSLGLGLEYMAASASFSTYRNDTAEKEPQILLYDFTGQASVILLRIPLRYEYMFGNSRFGLSFGLTPKIKLAALSTSSDPYADDPLNGSRRISPVDDFTSALNFAPRSFSVDGQVGIYLGL